MRELVSVIVPVYNGQDYLKKCIDSIEQQTYPELEIIIVNDGSRDHTADVCSRLQEEFSNIQVLTLNDEGVSAARNSGLAAARGSLIMFVDADDRLKKDTVAHLADILEKTQSDVCGCRFAVWQDEEELEKIYKQTLTDCNAHTQTYTTFSASEYAKEQILKGNCRCWSKLYRREVIGDIRFQTGLTIGEDMLFLVELLQNASRFAETTYEGYCYYRNPNGAMNRPFTPAYMNQILCWELAYPKLMTISEKLEPAVNAQMMISLMLIVGKLSELPGRKQREYAVYLRQCNDKLKRCMHCREAFPFLLKSYKAKVLCFGYLPALYVTVYHFLKTGMPHQT